MLLHYLAPGLRETERRLESTKRRAARSRETLHARGERVVNKSAAAIRSPEALVLAALAGVAGGRIGSTSRRLRGIEEQLATVERLIEQVHDEGVAPAQSRERGDGLDLQALLANITRLATLVSMFTSAQNAGEPDPQAAPDDVAATAAGQ